MRHFAESGVIRSPKIVNESESVILGLGLSDVDVCGAKVNLGVSLNSICQRAGNVGKVWSKIESSVDKESFAIFESNGGKMFDVLLFENFQPKDLFRAYIEAFWMAFRVNHPTKIDKEFESKVIFSHFEKSLRDAGWKTSHLQMTTQGWVGSFKKSV
jgi:hypothetical protein